MAYLVDTSILGRLANTGDTSYPVAMRAVLELHRRGEVLHITPQTMVEFRNVATRPVNLNGLGLTPPQAAAKAAGFEAEFSLLPETPEIYPLWKALVTALAVVGKNVHDARLVAVCHANNLTHLLTFNVSYFARFASFGPGITIADPGVV